LLRKEQGGAVKHPNWLVENLNMAINRLSGYVELGNCAPNTDWTFFLSQNVGSALLVILKNIHKLSEVANGCEASNKSIGESVQMID
jgi:hypothetical protein